MKINKSKSKSAEVVEVKPNAVALPYDYGEYAGQGTDDMSQKEQGIPFLKVLQALSPEVTGPKGQVEGAKAGLIFNTGSQELRKTVRVLPAARLHLIQEWRPRNSGGGLVNQTIMARGDSYPAAYQDAAKRAEKDGRKFGDFWTGEPKKSNQLSECYQLFCVVLDDDNNPVGMAVVPFTSTAIKVYTKQYSRRINSLTQRPPMFSIPIELGVTHESNSEGNWFNWEIKFPEENNPIKSMIAPDSAAFRAGAELFKLVKSGQAAVQEITRIEDDAEESAF